MDTAAVENADRGFSLRVPQSAIWQRRYLASPNFIESTDEFVKPGSVECARFYKALCISKGSNCTGGFTRGQ